MRLEVGVLGAAGMGVARAGVGVAARGADEQAKTCPPYGTKSRFRFLRRSRPGIETLCGSYRGGKSWDEGVCGNLRAGIRTTRNRCVPYSRSSERQQRQHLQNYLRESIRDLTCGERRNIGGYSLWRAGHQPSSDRTEPTCRPPVPVCTISNLRKLVPGELHSDSGGRPRTGKDLLDSLRVTSRS